MLCILFLQIKNSVTYRLGTHFLGEQYCVHNIFLVKKKLKSSNTNVIYFKINYSVLNWNKTKSKGTRNKL